jgi:hypothetical protein
MANISRTNFTEYYPTYKGVQSRLNSGKLRNKIDALCRQYGLKLQIHTNLIGCFKLVYGKKFPDCLVRGYYVSGKQYKLQGKTALNRCIKSGYWGFISNKKTIHLWYNENCTIEDLVSFFAHEYGHAQLPHLSRKEEEQKAGQYSDVALFAYKIANILLKE